MTINPIVHNTGGIFRFSDYISQIPDFLKAEPDAVTLLQVMSDYINNAYRNVTIVKKFKFKLIAIEHNVISTTNTLQKLADLFISAESHGTNMLFLSKVEDPSTSNPDTTQDPFSDPPTPNKFFTTPGGSTPRLIEFTVSNISEVRARKVKKVGSSIFYEVFFTATIDNIKNSKSSFEMDINDDGDATKNFLVNYYNYPIINTKNLEKMPYGFSIEFNGVHQGKTIAANINDITLDVDASDIDGFYNGYTIKIIGGSTPVLNQIRTITGYNGVTKIATISPNWDTIPFPSEFTTISPNASHMEWTKELIYSKEDQCSNLIDTNTLWDVDPLTIVDYLSIVTPVPLITPIGKYGSINNNAHATTVLSYNQLTEYSADLSVYRESGTLNANVEYPILSGITIGQISSSLDTNIKVGLSIQWDGIYLHVTNNGTEVYKEKLNGLSPTLTIYEKRIKIKINNNSLGIYIDNNLQHTIDESIASTKLGFQCIKNDFMYGFVDNIIIYGNDLNLLLPDSNIALTTPISLLGKGLFYARDLTNLDKTTEYIDFNTGVNKYLDPLFYKSIPPLAEDLPSLKYNFLVDDLKHHSLRIPFNNSVGLPFEVGDIISRLDTYTARVATTVNILLSNLQTIDGISLSVGDRVLVKDQVNPTENGIYQVNAGAWTRTSDILFIDCHVFISEGIVNINKAFELTTLDAIIIGTTNLPFYEVPLSKLLVSDNAAKITEVQISNNYLIVDDSYTGDWVSGGTFGKIVNGEISIPSAKLATLDSVSKLWDSHTVVYTSGTKVTYNNLKYKVLVSHYPSPNETPESNQGKYSLYMFDDDITEPHRLIIYKKRLEINPYMFGMYQVRHIPINQEPNYDEEGFAGLYDDLYIQPAEELDIKFKTLQRDWLFNPRVASNTELRRNGWMEVLSQEDSLSDMPTSTATNTLKDGTIIFSRQNLFDITENNPEIATIAPNTEGWYKYTLNTIEFHKTTSYDYKLFPLTRIEENNDELNVNLEVAGLYDEKDVQITTPSNIIITFDDINVDTNTNELVLNSVAPSNFVGSKIFLNNINPDNLPTGLQILTPYFVKELDNTLLKIKISKEFNGPEIVLIDGGIGTHTLTKTFVQTIPVKNGDVVNLMSQTTNPRENGRWRVINNGNWIRLSKKTALKISDIVIDFEVVGDLALSDDPVKYIVYTDTDVDNFIAVDRIQDVYKIDKGFATNFRFILEHVDGIDTTKPFNLQYDARFDSNTIADVSTMSKSFRGVPDMGYPLVEKIERLVYQKDPSVIDLELLAYLARFMGYDISLVSEDISESGLYSTDKERETALRRMIQNLPQYYALKATETGVESILLAFGVVGEVIKQWTSQDAPYEDFIPEDEIEDRQRSAREQGIILNLVPTPHFFLRLNIDNILQNDYSSKEFERINANVINYKPINTVFSGIIVYLTRILKQKISLSPLLGTAFFSADIGYDIDFSEIDNGC